MICLYAVGNEQVDVMRKRIRKKKKKKKKKSGN